MGLYRDDSIIIQTDLNLIATGKGYLMTLKLLGFKITIYTNLKIVNFLDVRLNLSKRHFQTL